MFDTTIKENINPLFVGIFVIDVEKTIPLVQRMVSILSINVIFTIF